MTEPFWIPVGGVPISDQAIHACRVTHTVDQASGILAFNTERFDIGGLHDTVTNNSRLTAQKRGVYSIFASVAYGSVTWNTDQELYVRLNGSTIIAARRGYQGGNSYSHITLSTLWLLNAGEYVELYAAKTGTNVTKLESYSPEFGMAFLGDG